MATIDFYAVLELSPTATEEDVRRAYRRLAVRWHPDKNPEDLITAERRFKEVSEAYEVLRDPTKRRQYDRLREGPARARRTTSWFDSSAGFGDDLWSEPEWGGSRPSWAFRNPFDVFREFFGQRDPWADMTPRSRRQPSTSRGPSSSFWSMGGDPFSSRPFSSPFFANRSTGGLFSQLLDQRRSATPDPVAPASPAPSTTRVEIKIGGFSDSEDTSDDEEILQQQGEGEEAQVVEEEEEEEEESIDVDDVALREAIRLSLAQEQERKRHEEQEAAQTEEELQEAIRRSLADLEKQRTVPTSGDWMDEDEYDDEEEEDEERLQRGRILPQQQQHSRQGLSAFH